MLKYKYENPNRALKEIKPTQIYIKKNELLS